MTSAKATIGVLGGMGPEATILFMQKMVEAVCADDDADHVPLIVHNNTQVPSRIRALIEGGGEDPGPVLAAMAASLQEAGAEALAMPCNTAHCYAAPITDAVSIPFLDMVHLAAGRALELGGAGARVGLLGSPALKMTGVFDGPLADVGLTPVYDGGEDLLGVIRSVKKNGVSPAATEGLRQGAGRLAGRGADIIMVCCTEFSLMADRLRSSLPLFDTLDVLVDACVAFSADPATETARRSKAAFSSPRTGQLGKEDLAC